MAEIRSITENCIGPTTAADLLAFLIKAINDEGVKSMAIIIDHDPEDFISCGWTAEFEDTIFKSVGALEYIKTTMLIMCPSHLLMTV